MELLSLIIYAILVIVSVAAWVNTKIILEEIDTIKKHLGIQEKKTNDLLLSSNPSDENE
ncbi:hypothetical protein [Ammoniphilus resinae]|uniref:Uncharacterized protein n=1 Tax=Ammoniphilus resinae TaxID=861532 RepID=A0ABS4GVD3_9BACL|nr:hypothetical protein [Ammoniphilus resinae]MBP1934223.1 hypothetical protein [Ammoniphilus resinae]